MAVSTSTSKGVVSTLSIYTTSAAAANAWTQVVASTSSVIRIYGYGSTSPGATADLATGAAGSEVVVFGSPTSFADAFFIAFPFPIRVPTGTRIAIRTSNSGQVRLYYAAEGSIQ